MAVIRTVLGDISPDEAGVTLTHEHLRYAYAGTEFDHHNAWTFEETAADVTRALNDGMEHGIRTVVDMTPAEIGRHPELFAETSRRSGMHVVAVTGFFPESAGMGIPFHWRRTSLEYTTEMLVRDLTEGMMYDGYKTAYKAGLLKCSTGGLGANEPTPMGDDGRRIGKFERHAIAAVARAQRQVGCCINTHTQPRDYALTNPGIELLDEIEMNGGDPTKVIIGHAFVHPNVDQLLAICKRDANLQIDHIGIPWQNESADQLDEDIANAVCAVADAGYLDRMVFSYDRFFSHARGPVSKNEPEQLNEIVEMGYLFEKFAPRLEKKGFGKAEMHQVMVENPKRLLAF
jgi:phosphotriesterase-related protein